jgi:hypothetical protein
MASEDAVRRYCRATEDGDMEAMAATLAPDAELPSPLSGRLLFRGRDDLRVLLSAVYDTISDLRWEEPAGEGRQRLAVVHARVGGLRIGDAMVFELDDSGMIRRIRPHLRPWLATTVFALMIAPKVARHPAIVKRALRPG